MDQLLSLVNKLLSLAVCFFFCVRLFEDNSCGCCNLVSHRLLLHGAATPAARSATLRLWTGTEIAFSFTEAWGSFA